jgi:hypothetical protein
MLSSSLGLVSYRLSSISINRGEIDVAAEKILRACFTGQPVHEFQCLDAGVVSMQTLEDNELAWNLLRTTDLLYLDGEIERGDTSFDPVFIVVGSVIAAIMPYEKPKEKARCGVGCLVRLNPDALDDRVFTYKVEALFTLRGDIVGNDTLKEQIQGWFRKKIHTWNCQDPVEIRERLEGGD